MSIYLPIAEMSMSLPLLAALGLAIGVVSGMFGIGGGFIMTPLLIFLGVPSAIAVGTGASQVTASSISGAFGHWRRGNVDTLLGVYLVAGGLVGAVTGVKLQQFLKSLGQLDFFTTMVYVVMLGVIGALMLIESLQAIMRAKMSSNAPIRKSSHHNIIQKMPLKQRFRTSKLYISSIPPVLIGALVGWLTAIMGVGGGFLLVPALIYVLRVPTRVALGTSGFQIIFVTIFATVLQATQNYSVDIMLAVPLMVGGVIGAQVGVGLGERLAAEQLRAVLAALVLAVAVRMAYSLVVTPPELYSIQLPG